MLSNFNRWSFVNLKIFVKKNGPLDPILWNLWTQGQDLNRWSSLQA